MTADEKLAAAQAILRRDIMPGRKVELLEGLIGVGELEPAPSNVGAEPPEVEKPGERRARAKAEPARPDGERESAPAADGAEGAAATSEPEAPATDAKPPKPPLRPHGRGRNGAAAK